MEMAPKQDEKTKGEYEYGTQQENRRGWTSRRNQSKLRDKKLDFVRAPL